MYEVMVEGSANEVSEDQFCEAVHLGFKEVRLNETELGVVNHIVKCSCDLPLSLTHTLL